VDRRHHLLVAACLVLAAGIVAATVHDPGRELVETAGGPEASVTLPTLPTTLPVTVTTSEVTAPTVTLPPTTVPSTELVPLPPVPGVFYVQPEGAARTVLQVSWTGEVRRRLELDQPIGCCGLQTSAPDGSSLRLGHDVYDDDGERRGAMYGPAWADDGVHACDLRATDPSDVNGPQDLLLIDFQNRERKIGTVPAAEPGTGHHIWSCNPERDRVVVSASNAPNRRTVVVRLSDGRVEDVPTVCSQGYGISYDGRYLVAATSANDRAFICDLDANKLVGGLRRPGQLTGDGSTVLTYEMDHCGWYHTLVLTDRVTEERLWSSADDGYALPCNQTYSDRRFHPTSPAFVLQVVTLESRAPGAVFLSDGRHAPRRIVDSAEYAVVF
jgi:hypothetical protein